LELFITYLKLQATRFRYKWHVETLNFLALTVIASLLGAALGFLAHFARAHLTFPPEDLGLGEPWDSLTRDDYNFEKYGIGAEWDDNGYWDDASNRNLIYMVASGFLMPYLFALLFWEQRSEVVASVCGGLRLLGLNPPTC
jgi:hypothetical protein